MREPFTTNSHLIPFTKKSGLAESKAGETSRRHNAMQWELPPWTSQGGQFMKMWWGMTHPIWSSTWSMKWTTQWTLIDLHVLLICFFWDIRELLMFWDFQTHPWLSSLPAPTNQPPSIQGSLLSKLDRQLPGRGNTGWLGTIPRWSGTYQNLDTNSNFLVWACLD